MGHTATTTRSGEGSGLRVETVKDGPVVRVALHGESDFSKVAELDQALQGVELAGPGLVCLDLTHLAFADVATIRRLAAFAGHARRAGPDVTTRGAHPTLRQVAGLLQVHGQLGLS